MSTISTNPSASSPVAPPPALPIEDGEHLTADELIRRWEALPEEWRAKHKHVELLEGVVRMSPPISIGFHGVPQFSFMSFLGIYAWATPGVLGSGNASVILNDKNMPEPDAFIAVDPKCGGHMRLDEKGYVHGAPELVAEIASSSVEHDLITKKELYRKFGVIEYVVWRTKGSAIDWFILRNDQYEPLAPDQGVLRSKVFPGLWLAADALIASDYARVNQVLQQGLASTEHAAFVEQLAKNKSA